MARDSSSFATADILQAADLVGKVGDPRELSAYLESDDSGVRYWALVALDAYEGDIASQYNVLSRLSQDESPSVAILASEILIKEIEDEGAYQELSRMLQHENEPLVLQAAISVRNLGEKAQPLIDTIQEQVMPKYSGDIWGRYKSWSYPMFIGMALDQTMENCGMEVSINN